MYLSQDRIATGCQNECRCQWPNKLANNVESSSSFGVIEPDLQPTDVEYIYTPQHLLLIPDGHRRWAKNYNVSYEVAYQNASSIGMSFVDAFVSSTGVNTLSMYLIGEHTLHRSSEELSPIFRALNRFLHQLSSLPIDNCSVEVIGRIGILPKKTQDLVHSINCEQFCDNGKPKKLNILIGYSGTRNVRREERRQDIRLLDKIDCIYRLGGKHRLSDAPIIESANGFLLVSNMLFPDLAFKDIKAPFGPINNQSFYGSIYRICPISKEIQ